MFSFTYLYSTNTGFAKNVFKTETHTTNHMHSIALFGLCHCGLSDFKGPRLSTFTYYYYTMQHIYCPPFYLCVRIPTVHSYLLCSASESIEHPEYEQWPLVLIMTL